MAHLKSLQVGSQQVMISRLKGKELFSKAIFCSSQRHLYSASLHIRMGLKDYNVFLNNLLHKANTIHVHKLNKTYDCNLKLSQRLKNTFCIFGLMMSSTICQFDFETHCYNFSFHELNSCILYIF